MREPDQDAALAKILVIELMGGTVDWPTEEESAKLLASNKHLQQTVQAILGTPDALDGADDAPGEEHQDELEEEDDIALDWSAFGIPNPADTLPALADAAPSHQLPQGPEQPSPGAIVAHEPGQASVPLGGKKRKAAALAMPPPPADPPAPLCQPCLRKGRHSPYGD